MVNKEIEERENQHKEVNPSALPFKELEELRSDLEIELYWLDRECIGMSDPDCIPDSGNRTSRDVEIDRDFILYQIDEINCELRKRIPDVVSI